MSETNALTVREAQQEIRNVRNAIFSLLSDYEKKYPMLSIERIDLLKDYAGDLQDITIEVRVTN